MTREPTGRGAARIVLGTIAAGIVVVGLLVAMVAPGTRELLTEPSVPFWLVLALFVACMCFTVELAQRWRRYGAMKSRLADEVSALAAQREYRALHDELTELPNRASFVETLDATIAAASGGTQTAVLVVGLDDFGEIKETLGYEQGDTVLCDVALRLLGMSPHPWTTARLSEDEFAILIPGIGTVGAAVRAADAVARVFEDEPFRVAGLTLEVGVRVGVAVHPEHGDSAQSLLRRGEIALRRARARHARVSLFLPDDDPHTPQQLVIAHELRQALERNELVVYVQPQLELAGDTVKTVEVLVRWVRDDRIVMPDDFIPVAERTGLIRPLTAYVLRRALEHRRQWASGGHELDIAVNVSVRDLMDPSFPEQVSAALQFAECPPAALKLEITETQIMADPERVSATLRRLAMLGVKVSIDDFGTGYSSLSSVRALSIDEVKIDKTFVKHAVDNVQDGTLVKSITDLGHGLGLEVVAEGVEDDRTLALLRAVGVTSAQGYGIARPMPARDLPAWLERLDANTDSGIDTEVG